MVTYSLQPQADPPQAESTWAATIWE